jgi:hypothetical protein
MAQIYLSCVDVPQNTNQSIKRKIFQGIQYMDLCVADLLLSVMCFVFLSSFIVLLFCGF